MIADNSVLADLLKMSRRAGERFDLVQAGGGNTSAKLPNGNMYVKASGLRLSDLQSEKSFVLVDNLNLRNAFYKTDWTSFDKKQKEKQAGELVSSFNMTKDRKPSIETLLHSILDGFVLHTHPVLVTSYFSGLDAKEKCDSLFSDVALVAYRTPGIELALEMIDSLKSFQQKKQKDPKAFIFQNHGLVTFAEKAEDAFQKTEEICNLLGKEFNFAEEKIANHISNAIESITKEAWVTIYSPKSESNSISINQKPFFPDAVVFLAAGVLVLVSIEPKKIVEQIQLYLDTHTIVPRVFYFQNSLYFSGNTYSKARESEEVWRLHHIASQKNPNSLSDSEIKYLSHWEAEKYRQKV
ncbi:MAG TPA: class II aldolase/adducin family protein [Leptospiraceae bacterium]|nr:class II aldolase/adducin family protein [Leptospiraceae bacterium]HMW03437.1 class II aldolase/adducin family protein [Leptospiraceae bacterium]HMX31570.1 class II aldolase/adducin family protein [Leptospiraceae bacterium]HMY29643.1 class II aldolase/adducin family protein [Leptospiraceae bacterium]HMZ66175.1 class II aldolase/adducin family protein [Leptospiraceae bacterium]